MADSNSFVHVRVSTSFSTNSSVKMCYREFVREDVLFRIEFYAYIKQLFCYVFLFQLQQCSLAKLIDVI